MAEESSSNSTPSSTLEVINNYKGVMLCSRPNEKKSVDYDRYPLYHTDLFVPESSLENR